MKLNYETGMHAGNLTNYASIMLDAFSCLLCPLKPSQFGLVKSEASQAYHQQSNHNIPCNRNFPASLQSNCLLKWQQDIHPFSSKSHQEF